MTRNIFRQFNKIFIVLSFVCIGTWTAIAQTAVISPTEGKWANYQSLVLDLPAGYEAYYSLTGADPLVSGFAYDGPMLVELTGNIHVNIVIIDTNGNMQTQEIYYTVDLQPAPAPAFVQNHNATLFVNDSSFIDIPEKLLYGIGDNNVFSPGNRLEISGDMLFERYVLLTICDASAFFRYVVQLGDATPDYIDADLPQVAEMYDSVEITDWNYITFAGGSETVYAVDDEPLKHTKSGKIFLDRTTEHELKWKYITEAGNEIHSDDFDEIDDSEFYENEEDYTEYDDDEFFTIILPPRPEIVGMPTVPITGSALHLTLSDNRYIFGLQTDNDKIIFKDEFVIDTLKGDAFGFSQDLPVYYDGINHGSIPVTVIIDKINPPEPIIHASNTSGYARENVTLSVTSEEKLNYYITEMILSADDDNFQMPVVSPVAKEDFIPMNKNTLVLENNSGFAQLFTVFFYSSDFAGNTSDTVMFQTVIDPYNYYLVQNPENTTGVANGTKNAPFTDFSQLYDVLNKVDGQRLYIDGVFTDVPDLRFEKNVSVIGSDTTRLVLAENASVTVEKAKLSVSSCTIEKKSENQQNILQQNLITAKDSILAFYDCEFYLSGDSDGFGFIINNCSVEMNNIGLTVKAFAYGVGFMVDNSVFSAVNVRSVVMGQTTVGMTVGKTILEVKGSAFTNLAERSRAIESVDSKITLIQNSFALENLTGDAENTAGKNAPAVWFDEKTEMNILSGNSYSGFSSLTLVR